jgi:hypothetical protein
MATFDETIQIVNSAWVSDFASLRAIEYGNDGITPVGSVITTGFGQYGTNGHFVLRKEFTIADGEQHTVKFYLVGDEDDSVISVVSPPAGSSTDVTIIKRAVQASES